MAILDPVKAKLLSVQVIPRVDRAMARDLGLQAEHLSIGMMTASSDDALYAALDESTKAADVEVVYGRSFYAGSAHASGPLSGEVIGILAARGPSDIHSGITAAEAYLREKAWFYAADEQGGTIFFPHVIAAVGSYLAAEAGIAKGTALAYLIAPPIEAMYAMDAALKAANVKLCKLYPPPSPTNFAGGLFGGDLPACEAAARAFQQAVLEVAARPHGTNPKRERGVAENPALTLGARKTAGDVFVIAATGERVATKPDFFTHLQGKTLVPKNHARIEFRGQLDNLQSHVIEAQVLAAQVGRPQVVEELGHMLAFLRKMLAAEYRGTGLEDITLLGLSAADLRLASHDPVKFFGPAVKHTAPDHSQGALAVRLNTLRTMVRQVEVSAAKTFIAPDGACSRPDILGGLNRLSSALYVMHCREAAAR